MGATAVDSPPAQLPWPQPDYSQFGELGEVVPLSRIQKLAAGYLSRNWQVIPHVTHQDSADITELEAFRKRLAAEQGAKLSLVPFLMKAMAVMLGRLPRFNGSLDAAGQNLIMKKYVHIGVAIDTPNGLLVGVVRDCDRKSVQDIGREVEDLAARARGKGLPMKEMVGGCMTVSSLGHIGGTGFTPIVNAPEVAILGVTRARQEPRRAADGSINWRLSLPLSLGYDHRVINGADAARFCAGMADLLSDPDSLTTVTEVSAP